MTQWSALILFGAIAGAIYWKPDQDTSGVQNLLGGFFFITMVVVFLNMGGAARVHPRIFFYGGRLPEQ